jgi:hypothetical protein
MKRGKSMAAKKVKPAEVAEKDVSGGWDEIPSTATVAWWHPGEDDTTAIMVRLKTREERETRYGARAYYLCDVLEDAADVEGEVLEKNTQLIIWESAGLRDLSRFLGQDVRIVPGGRMGRARVYRFFVRGGGQRRERQAAE